MPDQMPSFNGDVLVCEDNAMNRQFIKDLLTRVGLSVSAANDGQEGLDYVSRQMENGQKPFDLILMDIFMPVMGGLEAADALRELGCQTPIVAMTSNMSEEDKQTYNAHGMTDYLTKPFATTEVWACLSKYLKPVKLEKIDQAAWAEDKEKQLKRLHTNFVRSNQNTLSDLNASIESGDIKLAHRIAHTLSGVAGLMGKNLLQQVSRAIEHSLASGSAEDIEEQMSVLAHELNKALKELAPLIEDAEDEEPEAGPPDKEKALELFERLTPLLESDSANSLSLTDELRTVPGAGPLAEQIEDYEFEEALQTLAALRQTIGI